MRHLDLSVVSSAEAVAQAVAVLRGGGLVVYPTETTYGLGAAATNPEAIGKLLAYKTKRADKPLSVMVANQAMAEQYVVLNDVARQAYRQFLPGPVTVVSVGRHAVAPRVESAQGTLGIRISSYPLVRELAATLGCPFTATGANASGKKRPYTIDDILAPLSPRQKGLIDLILDADELPANPPSTVVDTTLDTYHTLRQGSVEFTETQHLASHSAEATQKLGQELAQKYRNQWGQRAVIFALEGELGAGKTQFVKGLASGLGITEPVRSPSYTLQHEYRFAAEGQTWPFMHIDAWRLEQANELAQLGLAELIAQKAVIALEWANSEVAALQPYQDQAKIIWIKLAYGAGENERLITWSDEVKLG